MKYAVTIIALFCSLFHHLNATAQTGWKWGIKNTGRGGMTSWPSAVDASGNIVVAGSTYGSAFSLDSMVFGTHTVHNTGHYNQLIITKVDTSGHYLWAIGSQGAHVGVSALSVDQSGDVLIVGSYSGASMMLGAITLTNASSSYAMFFIAKISSTGSVTWAKNILNNQGGYAPVCFGLGTDAAGNAYVSGNFYQYNLLMGSTLITNHDASGFTGDVILLKYNSAGTLKWARSFGGNHTDYPFIQGGYAGFDYLNNTMSVTPAGHIYLTGRFYSDSIKIGATTLYNPYGGTTEPGTTYSYLCKWDSSGNAIWAKHVNRKMQVNEVISNSKEEVFLAGILDSADTWSSISLNPGALVAKMDSTGSLLWAHTYPGGDAKSIGLDDSGYIFVTGLMGDTMSFGSDMLYAPTVHTVPMFIARFNPAGSYVGSDSVADGGIVACAVRPDNNRGSYYLVGNYFGTPVTFGPDVLDTAGICSETSFIARYKYVAPPAIVVSDVHQHAVTGSGITLYPNPANKVLSVQAQERIYRVQVTDMLGKNLYSVACDGELQQIDISEFPEGIYLVKINNSTILKFVKE